MIGNSIARAELSEYRRVKLSSVVADHYPYYAKPTKDILHHKALYLLLGYGCQRLGLGSLGEVINCDNSKLDLTLGH